MRRFRAKLTSPLIILSIVCLCAQSSRATQSGRSRGPALTAEQWTRQATCETRKSEVERATSNNLPFINIWSNLMDESCNNGPPAWRFHYIDELMPGFNHQVREKIADERLANILDMVSLGVLFEFSHMHYRSGDAEQDARNELLVAGLQVNDADCSGDLELVLRQFRDYKRLVENSRKIRDHTEGDNATWLELHLVWSLVNALVFLRMTTDWRLSRPMLWFSNQMWRSLAKLSYPIIFVHWLFILCCLYSQATPLAFNFWTIMATISLIILTGLPTSLLVHVIFENSLEKIIKGEILEY